jgi:hypothetical protein
MELDEQSMKPKTSAKAAARRKATSKNRITKSKKPRNQIIFSDLQARKQRQREAKARRK